MEKSGTPKGTAHSDDGAEAKRKPGFFSSLGEGIRKRREVSAVRSLVEAAKDGDEETLAQARSAVSELDGAQVSKLLAEMQDSLGSYSTFVFESPRKVAAATALASCIAEAATRLPANGKTPAESYPEAVRALRKMAQDDSLYDHGRRHRSLKLACAEALWELGYDRPDFWEDMLESGAAKAFTVRKMLDMEPLEEGEDFKKHGWWLLRKNLGSVAREIAQGGSEKSAGFFISMLLDEDSGVVRVALRGAVCLSPVPEEFFDIAKDISGVAGLEKDANDFIAAARMANMLRSEDGGKFIAAQQLAVLFSTGMPHLDSIVADAAERMAGIAGSSSDRGEVVNALDAFIAISHAGAAVSPAALEAVLEKIWQINPLMEHFYALTTHFAKNGSAEQRDISLAMERKRAGTLMEIVRNAPDGMQFGAAMELLSLFHNGRTHLAPELMAVAEEMEDVWFDPPGEEEARKNAFRMDSANVLLRLQAAGVPVFGGDALQDLIDMASEPGDTGFLSSELLIGLYAGGMKELGPALGEIGGRTADVWEEPYGEGEEARLRVKGQAEGILAKLSMAGIAVEGLDIHVQGGQYEG
ncbi:MAG: hypothetical protein AB1324_00080 [Candidatus Micrarchaeota archaeon]